MDEVVPGWMRLAWAAAGRCPCCGRGKLFAAYLKPVAACAVCKEAYGHIRADDGPAWLTILIVGHILAPFLLGGMPEAWPDWALVLAVMAATLLLTLLLLPRCKGVFIALIWRSGGIGTER